MAERKHCASKRKDGEPCRAYALPGKDTCFRHSQTEEQILETARKGQTAQARKRRAAKLDTTAIFREVGEAKLLDTTAKLLGGIPLTSPDSARNYLGQRRVTHEATYLGCMLLLALTGPHLTPKQARAALEESLPPELRPTFLPPVEDIYQQGRAEWRRTAINYAEVVGFFVQPYPAHLYAEWEDHEQVNANEPLPDLSEWQRVEGVYIDSPGHVLARTPDGEDVPVRLAASV